MSSGIPQLLNSAAAITNPLSLLYSDAIIISNLFKGSSWGIYYAGTTNLAIKPDTFVSLDYDKDWDISEYPVEAGFFSQYNKVEKPYRAKVRMACSGASGISGSSVQARETFIYLLDIAAASAELYDIITPEKTYPNCNITSVSYARSGTSGAAMIIADVTLVQIRQVASATFQNTTSPSSSGFVGVQTFSQTIIFPPPSPN